MSDRFTTVKFIKVKEEIIENSLVLAKDIGRVNFTVNHVKGNIPSFQKHYLILQDESVYLFEYYSTWKKYNLNALQLNSSLNEYSKYVEEAISIKDTIKKTQLNILGVTREQKEMIFSYQEEMKLKENNLQQRRKEKEVEAINREKAEQQLLNKKEEEKFTQFHNVIGDITNELLENEIIYRMLYNFHDQYTSDFFISDIRYFDIFADDLFSDIFKVNKKINLRMNYSYRDLIEGELNKFIKLLVEKKYVKKSLFNNNTGVLSVLKALQHISIGYFSKEFSKSYSGYFQELDNMDLEQCILAYNSIDIMDKQNKENISLFLCFLIDNHKLIWENNLSFFTTSYDLVESIINMKLEQSQMNQFEAELLRNTDIIIEKVTIDDIDIMNGLEFESFISNLFKKMGFSVNQTKSTGDQGIDVIAVKRGLKVGIQAKCYSGSVSNKAIQEVSAGMKYYNLSKGIVVTNNYFTRSAIELAQSNGIVIWDRDMLKEKINEYFK